ncbi:hypothetical protein BGZ68_007588 [Mortierella alpina]|nr:hypothetical protein BGZ68_007588 [Mortierella alpina]
MYSPLSHQQSSFLTTNSGHGPSSSTHPSFPSSSGLQSYHLPANSSSAMLAADDFARLCLSPLQSLPHTAEDNHYTTQNASSTTTNARKIRASPMLLLNDRNVDHELKLIAQKLVKKQRSDEGSASGLSLFVILPVVTSRNDIFGNHPFGGSRITTSSSNNNNNHNNRGLYAAAEQEFRLFFLCDYGGREDTSPKLHICDYNNNTPQLWGDVDMEIDGESGDASQSQPTHHHHAQPEHGHALRDLDDFLLTHAIPMLSLLRAVQDNMDAHMPGTAASDPLLAGRIRSAIRFLAASVHEELIEFQESPSPSEEECDEYESCLLEGDFLESSMTTAAAAGRGGYTTDDGNRNDSNGSNSSLVGIASGGGALCQMKQGRGLYPMEKSAEIQLYSREDADEFYSMVCEYQCVMKLKISLAWPGGVTEEDLWRLCEVVHASTLRELTLDCNADPAGAQEQDGSTTTPTTVPKPGFRPLLGILCRIGFVSLTVENHAGDIFPGGVPIHIQGRLEEFSLKAFRDAGESLVVVPENISLKKLTFRNWLHFPDRDGFASVFKCCPNLQEIETEAEVFDKMFIALQVATNNTLGKLSFLRVMQSYREQGAVSFSRLEGGEPAMLRVQRRTAKMMNPLLARFTGLENFSSLACIQMWEHTELLHDLVHNNIPTLESMEFACRTDYLPAMWSFLVQELDHAQQNLAANEAAADAASDSEFEGEHDEEDEDEEEGLNQQKEPVRLRLMDERGMNGLESACPQQVDQTSLVLRTYNATFRPYLKNLSQFATTLCFEQEFVSAEELSLLVQHVAEDGLFFHNLAWHLSPQVLRDVTFLQTLHTLVHHPEVQQFTIRIDNGGADPSDVQMSTLLQIWMGLTEMKLDRVGCGRWMQECAAQLEHPFKERVQLPNGGGELMFASENMVEIGATASTMCPSFAGSAGGHRGPRIYLTMERLPDIEQLAPEKHGRAPQSTDRKRSLNTELLFQEEGSSKSPQLTPEVHGRFKWLRGSEGKLGSTNMTQDLRFPRNQIHSMTVYYECSQDGYVVFWDDVRDICKGAQYLLQGDTIVPFITDDDFDYVVPLRFEYIHDVVIDVVTEEPIVSDKADAAMDNVLEPPRKNYPGWEFSADNSLPAVEQVTNRYVPVGEVTHSGDLDDRAQYWNSTGLRLEQRINTDERRYQCTWTGCRELFSRHSALIVHYRTHTEEEPQVCEFEFCQKSFSDPSSLARHREFHTGTSFFLSSDSVSMDLQETGAVSSSSTDFDSLTKSHSCEHVGCALRFASADDLKSHLDIHLKVVQHLHCRVDGCDKKFAMLDDLRRHQDNFHTVVIPETSSANAKSLNMVGSPTSPSTQPVAIPEAPIAYSLRKKAVKKEQFVDPFSESAMTVTPKDPDVGRVSGRRTPSIHLSSDKEYQIRDPDTFFDKYGAYALTMMEYVKYGYRDSQVIIDPLDVYDTLGRHGVAPAGITNQDLRAAVDETIDYLRSRLKDDRWRVPCAVEELADHDYSETVDLRQLLTFLVYQQKEGVPGSLYRRISNNGSVTWMCLDHHRLHYSEDEFNATKTIAEGQGGTFDEQLRRIQFTAESDNSLDMICLTGLQTRNHDVQEISVRLKYPLVLDKLFCLQMLNDYRLTIDGTGLDKTGLDDDMQDVGFKFDCQATCVELKGFSLVAALPVTSSRVRALTISSPLASDQYDEMFKLKSVLSCSPVLVELQLTVMALTVTEVLNCIFETQGPLHFRLLTLTTQEQDVASISLNQRSDPSVLKVVGISIVFGPKGSVTGRTKFSDLFRHYGWCLKSLATNDTFVDHHAMILAIPAKGEEYKLTSLVLNAISLSAVGLGCLDVIIYRSKNLQRLSLVLEKLHDEEQFEKALLLLKRYGAQLTKLTLSGDSTFSWITKFAEKFSTRSKWPRLRTLQIVRPIHWGDAFGIPREWDAEFVSAPSSQTSAVFKSDSFNRTTSHAPVPQLFPNHVPLLPAYGTSCAAQMLTTTMPSVTTAQNRSSAGVVGGSRMPSHPRASRRSTSAEETKPSQSKKASEVVTAPSSQSSAVLAVKSDMQLDSAYSSFESHGDNLQSHNCEADLSSTPGLFDFEYLLESKSETVFERVGHNLDGPSMLPSMPNPPQLQKPFSLNRPMDFAPNLADGSGVANSSQDYPSVLNMEDIQPSVTLIHHSVNPSTTIASPWTPFSSFSRTTSLAPVPQLFPNDVPLLPAYGTSCAAQMLTAAMPSVTMAQDRSSAGVVGGSRIPSHPRASPRSTAAEGTTRNPKKPSGIIYRCQFCPKTFSRPYNLSTSGIILNRRTSFAAAVVGNSRDMRVSSGMRRAVLEQ